MCTRVLTDKILPPSFRLKWGNDGGRCQDGKKEQAGTHWEHWKITVQKLLQKKITNTYLCWGQF